MNSRDFVIALVGDMEQVNNMRKFEALNLDVEAKWRGDTTYIKMNGNYYQLTDMNGGCGRGGEGESLIYGIKDADAVICFDTEQKIYARFAKINTIFISFDKKTMTLKNCLEKITHVLNDDSEHAENVYAENVIKFYSQEMMRGGFLTMFQCENDSEKKASTVEKPSGWLSWLGW